MIFREREIGAWEIRSCQKKKNSSLCNNNCMGHILLDENYRGERERSLK
jgi:hypothetical protein